MLTHVDQQLKIEDYMVNEAKLRLTRDNDKAIHRSAWSESKLGIAYARSASLAFQQALVTSVYTREHTVGRQVIAYRLLRDSGLPAAVVSHLFSKALFNVLAIPRLAKAKKVSLCIKIADLLHDEMRLRFFALGKNRRALLKKLFATFDKRTYPRDWRKRTILNYFHAEQIAWEQWSKRQKLVIGYALLVLFRDSTKLIEFNQSSHFVTLSQHLCDHYLKQAATRTNDFFIYRPMVVPPKPWSESNFFRGGYISSNVAPYPLVKGTRPRDVERMISLEWSRIIPAINALQETAWRIDQRVLNVLTWLAVERGGDAAGLPPSDPKPLPPEPFNYGTDEAVTKEHNRVCFLIHSSNREIISRRLALFATINIAQQFQNYDRIYFPHNLDSRGRAYPLVAFLNPQGPDYARALLDFALPVSIESEEQVCWLAVMGANAFGHDKVSLQDRVHWTQDNEEMIFSVADDPRSDLRWTKAAEPFQFLRFCFEWRDFWQHGYGFKSHFVAYVDATCSGLQHYSALFRDEIGGRSVNLIPGLDRQDIYQDVADRVVEKCVEKGMDQTDPDAWVYKNLVRFGVDRKITKRQVMVVPYSGTFSSCMNYTRDAVSEKIKEGHQCHWKHDDAAEHSRHIVCLSRLIWAAIDEIVLKGKEGMRFLNSVAYAHSRWANKTKRGGNAYAKAIRWRTPDGFECVHFRADSKKAQIETYLDGAARVRLALHEDTPRLSGRDMALALAPNFVHSLDANLLRASVMRGLNQGITSYAMIHDSFGVHAALMPLFLDQCVKPAFVEMYNSTDPLADLTKNLDPSLELPAPPSRGVLELEGVMASEFFFS